MAIPTPPAAPNPLGTNFSAEALAFTQWMQTAAPEFNTAVSDANQAVLDAQTEGGAAVLSAESARDAAQGHAADADTARGLAVTAQGLAEDARDAAQGFAVGAEDARDMSQTYAALAGAAAGLPALAGNGDKALYVKTDASGVEFRFPVAGAHNLLRSARTSAYTAVAGDKGNLLDCTGTWTLGFTAAATLGAGWWCYVRNSGTGTITADPNASETIDGLTSGSILPGMTLLVICDGTALYCVKVGPRVAISVLTTGTSGTVPLGVRNIRARVQGAGGRGTSGAMCGAYAEAYLNVTPGASYTYAIGAAATSIGPGGDTTLTMGGRTITCKGGTQSQSSFVTAAGGDINIAGSASNTWPVASPLGAGGSSSTSAAGYGGASTDVNSGAGVIILEY